MNLFDTLLHGLLQGDPPPGAVLPAERELARRHGVGRPAVREALRRLEALGLTESRHGSGTVVRPWQREATLELLPHYLGAGAPGADLPRLLREILRLRVYPCCEVVRLAAVYAGPAAFDAAHARVDDAAAARADPAAFALLDLDIYRHLAMASDFPPAVWLLNTALPAFRLVVSRFEGMVRPPADYRPRMHDVLRAASQRRASTAVEKLQKYLQRHDRRVLRNLGIPEAP